MDVKECFDKRLLKRISVDKLKVEGSLNIAENKLLRAKKLFEEDFFDETLISAYTAFFHSARALLYKDGIQEKSHYATYVYINEKYANKIPKHLLEAFKVYQLERHKAIYGFDYEATKEDAENSILDAEEFIEQIKKILYLGKK